MGSVADPRLRRLFALGGVLAPLVFLGAVIVTAGGRPEYHHATQAISELGEVGARNAALMNYGGFLLYGLLIVGLAVGLHQGIRRGSGDLLGPLLLLSTVWHMWGWHSRTATLAAPVRPLQSMSRLTFCFPASLF